MVEGDRLENEHLLMSGVRILHAPFVFLGEWRSLVKRGGLKIRWLVLRGFKSRLTYFIC